MDIKIHKQDLSREFYTDEGCYILEVANTDNDPNVSIARARVEAGKTTRWHKLDGISERYLIIQGHAEVEIGDLPVTEVLAGEVVTIPPDTRQRIRNIGQGDLIFYCICDPVFSPDQYIDLE